MLTVTLNGGLGNQLFQMAMGYSLARAVQYEFYFPTTVSPVTHHSGQNYFDSIFRNMRRFQYSPSFLPTIVEEPGIDIDWSQTVKEDKHVCLTGYFQDYKYQDKDFVDLLVLPKTPTLEGVFLHIRGGDYVGHWQHDVGLEEYYKTAVSLFPVGTMFYVFTNDIPYAKTLSFLNTIPHEFIEEPDEVKTLSMMRNCRYGGICANSSFSWWGAYLNRSEERVLVLPSKWFNHLLAYRFDCSIEGYFFPEAIVLQV